MTLVVASEGLIDADSIMLYGRRIARSWYENGVSWTYFHASADSAWLTAGGDVNTLPCTDTIIIDTSVRVFDTLRVHLDTGFVRYLVESDNCGWLMMAENIVDRATFQVYTEDAPSEAYWPALTVYYSEGAPLAALPPRRRMISMTGGTGR